MDGVTTSEFDQLLAVFRDQSLQILEEMSHDLLALESDSSDAEAMTRLRRSAHTIKGDSACVGLEAVTQVAHQIEDLFDAVLNKQLTLDRASVDAMLKALDALREALSGERVADVPPENAASLIESLTRIEMHFEPYPACENQSAAFADNQSSKPGDIPKKNRRDFVRVEAAKLDSLLNLAGEMVIARSVINQIAPELDRTMAKSEMMGRFSEANSQMGKLIGELQKSVLKMRMVTIDHVFRKFVRPMRELAAEHGKQVELHVSGGETELDRALVDLIYEPLLHLLRNAVDHGLETPHERQAAGKSETCKITIRAYHEGNQVVVEVADDGRGIDPAVVKAKALQSSAITEQQAREMSDEDAVRLIFLEGLSTAKEITKLSGRGIGASAVKSAVEQLRGTVSVESVAGAGTRFTIRMPLTLAIIRALLFRASGQLLALPLLAVSEIARINASGIIHLNDVEHYRLRERLLSLVRPGLVLSFDRRRGGRGATIRNEAASFFLVVLTAGNKSYAVVADELLGEQELVIKPLDSPWVQHEALSGASLLGDGRVVLIMDPEMVFRTAVKYERGRANIKEAYAI
jgi:two-component system chemotaxis sensor kinase CheA